MGKASNGKDALALAIQWEPDIAVVDLAMPELNGLGLIQALHDNAIDCLSIVLSMYSTEEHVIRATQTGARGYLLKESADQEVIQAITTVFGGAVYLSHKLVKRGIMPLIERMQNPLGSLTQREQQVLQNG